MPSKVGGKSRIFFFVRVRIVKRANISEIKSTVGCQSTFVLLTEDFYWLYL